MLVDLVIGCVSPNQGRKAASPSEKKTVYGGNGSWAKIGRKERKSAGRGWVENGRLPRAVVSAVQ